MGVGCGQVTLRLLGPLRQAVGRTEVQLECAGGSVSDALASFAQERQDVRRFILDGEGGLLRSLILLLNDEPITDGPATQVRDGDVITILLPLAGG